MSTKNPEYRDDESLITEQKQPMKSLAATAGGIWTIKVLAWISLTCGVISFSWTGPFFKLLNEEHHVPPLRAIMWRQQAVVLYLLLPALWEVRRATPAQRKAWVTPTALCNLWWASLCWAFCMWLWLGSLVFTTTVRASLFSSLSPIVLAVHARVTGVRLSKGELVAVATAMIGVVVCMGGGLAELSQLRPDGAWIGDVMSFLSSFAWAYYFVFSARCRKTPMPICFYASISSLLMGLLVLPATMGFESTMPSDVFNWISPEFLKLVLLFGMVGGVMGILGLNWAVAHITPILVSMVSQLDPLFTGVFAWLLNVDSIPDVYTFIGGAIILAGVTLACWEDEQRKKAMKAQEALKQVED